MNGGINGWKRWLLRLSRVGDRVRQGQGRTDRGREGVGQGRAGQMVDGDSTCIALVKHTRREREQSALFGVVI